MHALGGAQRLRDAGRGRGHGGGYCDVVRDGLAGGGRGRGCGDGGLAVAVGTGLELGLGSLEGDLACGRG